MLGRFGLLGFGGSAVQTEQAGECLAGGMEMDGFEFSISLPIIPLPYRPEIFVYDNTVA